MSTLKVELKNTNLQPLGNGISVKIDKKSVTVWRNGGFLFKRDLDSREKSPELRLLVVQLFLDYNAKKSKIVEAFSIFSRQSLDNWIDSYKKDNLKGLINSTKNIGNNNRSNGNKAKQHSSERAIEKQLGARN